MAELAVMDNNEINSVNEEQLVTMVVDDQLFGIPILLVQDIVEPMQITPVPLAPSAIAGVLNLRGRIVTVIDLRECLRAPRRDDFERQMSVTVEYKGDLYTLLVDSIGDVRSLPKSRFDSPPSTLDENMKRICSGIFQLEHNLLVVLDVAKILNEESLMQMPRMTRKRRLLETKKKQMQIQAKEKQKEPANSEKEETKENLADNIEKEDVKSAAKSTTKKEPASNFTLKNSAKESKASPREPRAAQKKNDAEMKSTPAPMLKLTGEALQNQIMKVVELYAAKVDTDPVLQDLYKDVGDVEMLDAITNFFKAAIEDATITQLKTTYKTLIKQPHINDDHIMNSANIVHSVLIDSKISPALIDKIMSAVDTVRIELTE